MIVALHSELRSGAVDGYRAEHRRIPDDLATSFARVGIHDWTIWRSGERLFHLVTCDDFDAAMAELADDPANERWQATIGEFVEAFRDADGTAALAPLEQVWSLATQEDAS
ncbi:L-rhamnose mutarotase [Cellulomonas sp. URHD0024]|uniref:L-rhamnose mutarotase n=1 Tax=Cellulomonas sp. URHD0024 TaxID=1302620 RepID=UPI0004209777|nr:L-rhamnose mutarotase [Cellulomonas sp. URHD0024]